MTLDEIRLILPTIPELPGCYQHLNAQGEIIYIGKAKNLRRRVSSYFQKEHHDRKTRQLVAQIADVKYIVVATESDALLLENNLIKTYQPRYNILLKDDKSYPSIVVSKEEYPRIFITRQIDPKFGTYFGPYTDVPIARTLLNTLRELYQIRTCRLPLNEKNIAQKRYSTCLQYHIKKCQAPCIGYIDKATYNQNVEQAKKLLKGELQSIIEETEKQMLQYSQELRFEEAAEAKHKLELLQAYKAKHIVAPSVKNDVDVFSYEEDEEKLYINMLQVHLGAITRAVTVEQAKRFSEERDDLFAEVIVELRNIHQSKARELILPHSIDWLKNEGYTLTIPQQGEKKRLLELSQDNVKRYKVDQWKRSEKLNPEQRVQKLMNALMQTLQLPTPPRHIECFDNSHLQGSDAVASCVVFRNGKPSKKEYRKFHVKQAPQGDDTASMREILKRRYTRLLEEETPLPQLIVVDGGKAQLQAALETLQELGIDPSSLSLLGLAERMEEVYYPHQEEPLFLPRNSEALRLLMAIRDEAHRFAITFHRNTRSKRQVHSQLDHIPGIGTQSKEALLKHFGSVKRIREATQKDIEAVIGSKRALLLIAYLNKLQS